MLRGLVYAACTLWNALYFCYVCCCLSLDTGDSKEWERLTPTSLDILVHPEGLKHLDLFEPYRLQDVLHFVPFESMALHSIVLSARNQRILSVSKHSHHLIWCLMADSPCLLDEKPQPEARCPRNR